MARASSLLRNRKTGAPAANRKLVALARDFAPDIIVFGHADTIRPATLDQLREACPGVKLVQWTVDPLFLSDDMDRLMSKIGHVDWSFTSTGGIYLDSLRQKGFPVAFLPNPVDPSIERARNFEFAREQLPYDLFYAAGNPAWVRAHAGIEVSSAEIVSRVSNAYPALRGLFPGCRGTSLMFGAAFENALASAAMGLNISRRNDVLLYSSDRFAQLAGSGMLVFIDRATGYGDIFDENELAFYSTEGEMLDRIGHFFADDAARRDTARRGWAAYNAAFGVTKVARYMMDVVLGEIDPTGFSWRD